MYKANVNCSILKEQISFLIKQGLIEERVARKKHVVFAVTQKGLTVLKYFRELNSALLVVETAKSQRTPQPFLY
jgi:predicted transcriptional regulator